MIDNLVYVSICLSKMALLLVVKNSKKDKTCFFKINNQTIPEGKNFLKNILK